MAKIEQGVLIDNTQFTYLEEELIERLGDFAGEIGASVPAGDYAEYIEDESPVSTLEHSGTMYEFEVEYIEAINDVLVREHDLVLTVGEVEPGLYLIEEVI